MSLLERFKNFTTGTPKRTLVSSVFLILLIPLTLLANSQRWELRKDAAEPSSFAATDQLLQAAKVYTLAIPLNKSDTLEELISVASQRKTRLLQEIAEDPKTFLSNTLPSDVRAQLPKELYDQGLIERDIRVEGKLDILHFDDFENKKGRTEYKIKGSEGDYNLHFTGVSPNLSSGDEISIQGMGFDLEVAVDLTNRDNLQIVSTATPRTAGDIRIAVLMINFTDLRKEPWTIEEVTKKVFSGPNSTARFLEEVSYNQAHLSGDVFGWFELDQPSQNCYDLYRYWTNGARSQARNAGINLENYDKVAYLFPYIDHCFGGMAKIGGDELWINAAFNVFPHELGHTFNLYHSNALDCQDEAVDEYSNCYAFEGADPYDNMSWGQNYYHFNAAQKTQLRWLRGDSIQDILTSGSYTLYPLESGLSNIPKVLRIHKPDTGEYYYLEYRKPVGFDADLPERISNSTLVHVSGLSYTSFQGIKGTFLVDTTPTTYTRDESITDGDVFVDEPNEITITQISHDDEHAIIEVTIPPSIEASCPENTNPEPSLGKAVYFNEHTYIKTSSPNTLRGKMGEGFTVEAWIKPEFKSEYEGIAYITYRKIPDVSGTLYSLFLGTSPNKDRANLRFSFGEISGKGGLVQSDYVIALGEWTHVAGVKDGSELKLFINGQLVATRPFININDPQNGVNYVGGWRLPYQSEPIYTFKGMVDDLRISNVARDVAANWKGGVYESPLTVDEDTLALWRFEENMLDGTQNNNDATARGNVCFTQGRIGPPPSPDFGKALKFDPKQIVGVEPAYIEMIPSEKLLIDENFTIEVLVKPDKELINPSGNDPQNPRFILAKEGIPGEAWGYSLDVASRKVEFGVNLKKNDGARVRETLFGQTELEQDRWYFIQAIKNGNELSLYLNGQLEATKTVGGAVEKEATLLTVGCAKMKNFPSCLSNFYGEIDEVRVSNVARPVTNIPTRPFSSDEHTIALWHFDQNTLDATNNDLDGQTFGNINYINSTVGADDGCVPESLLPGDLDCDCDVDVVDVMKVATLSNTEEGDDKFKPEFDFDGDGRISVADIMYVTAKWNTRCL